MLSRLGRAAKEHAVYVVALLVLLPVYFWRVRYGVDITDEGYYALMPVSWLRSSGEATGNLSPHQFSAVLYSPLVRLYAALYPDLTGLILFLRRVYVVLMLGTSVLAYRFFRRLLPSVSAAACGLLPLAFIPWGFPAVSYNTLAMALLSGGLFVLGGVLLNQEAERTDGRRGLFAAALLAVGGVAYPSLLPVVVVPFALLVWLFPDRRRFLFGTFAAWVACSAVLLALAAWQIGGVGRVIDVFGFSRELYSDGVADKVRATGRLFVGESWLIMPCGVVFALGCLRRAVAHWGAQPAHVGGVVAVAVWWITSDHPPTLFARGHDLVMILCFSALPMAWLPGRHRTPADRVLIALFVTGVVGGLTTAFSATNGLINFCVLGILAATVGLAWNLQRIETSPRFLPTVSGALGLVVVGGVAWASLCVIYGEDQLPYPWQVREKYPLRLREGPYAGLRTNPWKPDLIRKVDEQLRPYHATARTVDFWTSASGLYLLTPFELRTPMPYWLEDARTGGLNDRLTRHYATAANRPDVVVLWTMSADEDRGVNRVQLRLLADHYREMPAESPIRIFLRSDLPPPTGP